MNFKWSFFLETFEKTEVYIFQDKDETMWKTLVALNRMFFTSLKLAMATQLNRLGRWSRSLNVPTVDLTYATNWTFYCILFSYADYERAKEDDKYNWR